MDDLQTRLAELKAMIAQFMGIHNNPHDTSDYNELAAKLNVIDPIIKTVLPSPPPVSITDISDSVGHKGANKDADVRIVQTLLDLEVDGKVGKNTIAAIVKFQKSIPLRKPDGRIDAGGTTWKKLKGSAVVEQQEDQSNDKNPPAVTITDISDSVGHKGANKDADVRIVQTLLDLEVDGKVGKNTIAAIVKFQKSIPLRKPDGRIDAGGTTWKKLKGSTAVEDNGDQQEDNQNDDQQNDSSQNDSSQNDKQDDNNNKNDDNQTDSSQNDKVGDSIKQSVGLKGINDEADVLIVQTLLRETWGYSVPLNGKIDDKTIQAIRKFQYRYVGSIYKQDSKVDAGGKTWKYLTGVLKPVIAKTDDGILGGAETPLEKKMAEFTQVFTGIQIEVSPGQFVAVRPPYHINLGKRAAKAAAARAANKAVLSIVRKLGYGGGVGKATPEQIKKFLEFCISKNLVKDKTSQGMHEFLELYGVSTDCSGLAIQAANFLVQGDMERSNKGQHGEDVKITNTAGIQQHPKVGSPAQLRAGDMMVNYKRKGTKTYHVRIVIDVDVEDDGIAFTTVESGSASDLGDGGNGVGQRRWKFHDGSKFENVQILKGNTWTAGGKSDQAYTYVRMRQLANI